MKHNYSGKISFYLSGDFNEIFVETEIPNKTKDDVAFGNGFAVMMAEIITGNIFPQLLESIRDGGEKVERGELVQAIIEKASSIMAHHEAVKNQKGPLITPMQAFIFKASMGDDAHG